MVWYGSLVSFGDVIRWRNLPLKLQFGELYLLDRNPQSLLKNWKCERERLSGIFVSIETWLIVNMRSFFKLLPSLNMMFFSLDRQDERLW